MNYFSIIFYSYCRGPLDDVRTIYKDHLRTFIFLNPDGQPLH